MKSIINFLKSKKLSKGILILATFVCIFAAGTSFGMMLVKWRHVIPDSAYPISGIVTLILGIYYLYLLAKGKY